MACLLPLIYIYIYTLEMCVDMKVVTSIFVGGPINPINQTIFSFKVLLQTEPTTKKAGMDGFAHNPASLQEHCLAYIIAFLEQFSPASLALLPPRFVSELASRLPLADLCLLENSAFASALDFKQLWSSICAKSLPKNSAESFYLESREWLKELDIAPNSREFFLLYIANCALHSRYMPLGDILSLLLVRTSGKRDIQSLIQLCNDDEVPSDEQPLVNQLSKGDLVVRIGKDIGMLIPERYLSYILQWDSPELLVVVLAEVVKYCPRVVWVPENASDEHLTAILGWDGIGNFLSGVEAFHLSLSDPRVVDDVLVGSWAPFLAEVLFSHSFLLHSLHIVGSQAGLDRFFGHWQAAQVQDTMLRSIDITSEKDDRKMDKMVRGDALVNLASLLEHSQATLTDLHLSYKCVPSIQPCRRLGQALGTVVSQPIIKNVSLHQLSILPQHLVQIVHAFLESRPPQEQTMLLSELYVVFTTARPSLVPASTACQGCQPLKDLAIISTKLTPETIVSLVKHSHIHLRELHLDDVQMGSTTEIDSLYSSPNFHCERLILESCMTLYSPTALRSLLKNTSLRTVEVSGIDHSCLLEDITCGLRNQSSLGTLTELSLISCKMHGEGRVHDKLMQDFFTALFGLPQLEQFTLKLQYLGLQLSDVQLMLEAWKGLKLPQKQLRSLTMIDACCTKNVESAVNELTKHLSFRSVYV